MGWRNEVGHGTGDEPDPGFGPPRRGAHHDAEPSDVAPNTSTSQRDGRLAGFSDIRESLQFRIVMNRARQYAIKRRLLRIGARRELKPGFPRCAHFSETIL